MIDDTSIEDKIFANPVSFPPLYDDPNYYSYSNRRNVGKRWMGFPQGQLRKAIVNLKELQI